MLGKEGNHHDHATIPEIKYVDEYTNNSRIHLLYYNQLIHT